MSKTVFYTPLFFLAYSITAAAQQRVLPNVAAGILSDNLQAHICTLTSDSMQGRLNGTEAALKAADYIAACFEQSALQMPYDSSYYQAFVTPKAAGVNVIGLIEGNERRDEAVIVSAHYDHVGTLNGQIYHGADDNASGVAAMLEIAQAFAEMLKNDCRPQRSVVFIAFDAKESELAGSGYYVRHPLFPMNKTFVNLNIDAVGRVEGSPNGMADYLLLVGVDRISPDLLFLSDSLNRRHSLRLYLDRTFYDSDVFTDVFYTFSDQYPFAQHRVPAIYYTGGLHDDLYRPTDIEEYIHYDVLKKRTQLIFYTAWELANRPALTKHKQYIR
ncbi:MAG: M28 family peptidase [Prevotellaceae bacterium]|jgi:hypothetical protein|nr:M28 family peptidase [Prevotellaceae bacterium]